MFRESLSLLVQLGDKLVIAGNLEGLANALASGAPARSARLYGAAEAIREAIGVPRVAIEQRHVAPGCAELGEEAWQAAQAAGRAMTLEQAVAYALEEHRSEPLAPHQ